MYNIPDTANMSDSNGQPMRKLAKCNPNFYGIIVLFGTNLGLSALLMCSLRQVCCSGGRRITSDNRRKGEETVRDEM